MWHTGVSQSKTVADFETASSKMALAAIVSNARAQNLIHTLWPRPNTGLGKGALLCDETLS
ncbi:hypothetical protein CSC82_02275 [Rhodobacteraceae bacterium 4F10]|nr:hypothetical protein CSC82_02275 [Rhodobacteraceae bacterium 4F10]